MCMYWLKRYLLILLAIKIMLLLQWLSYFKFSSCSLLYLELPTSSFQRFDCDLVLWLVHWVNHDVISHTLPSPINTLCKRAFTVLSSNHWYRSHLYHNNVCWFLLFYRWCGYILLVIFFGCNVLLYFLPSYIDPVSFRWVAVLYFLVFSR